MVTPVAAKLEFEFDADDADVIKVDPLEFEFDDAVDADDEADAEDEVGVVTIEESIGIAKLADEEPLADTVDDDETARLAKAFVNKLTPVLTLLPPLPAPLIDCGCGKTDPLTPVVPISLEGDF